MLNTVPAFVDQDQLVVPYSVLPESVSPTQWGSLGRTDAFGQHAVWNDELVLVNKRRDGVQHQDGRDGLHRDAQFHRFVRRWVIPVGTHAVGQHALWHDTLRGHVE